MQVTGDSCFAVILLGGKNKKPNKATEEKPQQNKVFTKVECLFWFFFPIEKSRVIMYFEKEAVFSADLSLRSFSF